MAMRTVVSDVGGVARASEGESLRLGGSSGVAASGAVGVGGGSRGRRSRYGMAMDCVRSNTLEPAPNVRFSM